MTGSTRSASSLRRAAAALALGLSLGLPLMQPLPAVAQQQQQQHRTQHGPESVADLAEQLMDAVVNISTSQKFTGSGPGAVPLPRLPEGSPFQEFFDEFFRDRERDRGGARRMQSLGSGFVIDAAEGLIITNNHVIADADAIEVNFSDGSTLSAELVGTDPKTDIALLRVDPGSRQLTEIGFGDSDSMRIGDWVMAIGNPFGLGGTVTVGIISARDRDINAGPYDDFIQTDAAINRGNSGGPLFNMYGEVIGINTAIISPSGGSIGIGFAIPSNLAARVVEQLREFGETRRGWLGVRVQPVTPDIAESLGMDRARGALVAGVIEGGPVDDGSIQPGDVIIRFDGREIGEMRDLPRVVAESPVGKEVEVRIIRRGEEQTVRVTLGRLEDGERLAAGENGSSGQEAPASTVTVLGMTLGEIDEEARKTFGIAEDVGGVLVREVDPKSLAAEKGIVAGDVIVEIAQEAVSTPAELAERIDSLRRQGRRNALLMISSATGELRFITLRMD